MSDRSTFPNPYPTREMIDFVKSFPSYKAAMRHIGIGHRHTLRSVLEGKRISINTWKKIKAAMDPEVSAFRARFTALATSSRYKEYVLPKLRAMAKLVEAYYEVFDLPAWTKSMPFPPYAQMSLLDEAVRYAYALLKKINREVPRLSSDIFAGSSLPSRFDYDKIDKYETEIDY